MKVKRVLVGWPEATGATILSSTEDALLAYPAHAWNPIAIAATKYVMHPLPICLSHPVAACWDAMCHAMLD